MMIEEVMKWAASLAAAAAVSGLVNSIVLYYIRRYFDDKLADQAKTKEAREKRRREMNVAYHGTPYLFKDGAVCYEVDTGADIQEAKETEALTLELAADHEARLCAIELGV